MAGLVGGLLLLSDYPRPLALDGALATRFFRRSDRLACPITCAKRNSPNASRRNDPSLCQAETARNVRLRFQADQHVNEQVLCFLRVD